MTFTIYLIIWLIVGFCSAVLGIWYDDRHSLETIITIRDVIGILLLTLIGPVTSIMVIVILTRDLNFNLDTPIFTIKRKDR